MNSKEKEDYVKNKFDGVKKGGKYTFKEPSPEELAGYVSATFGSLDNYDGDISINDWVSIAKDLLETYEIRQRLLDGKPIKK